MVFEKFSINQVFTVTNSNEAFLYFRNNIYILEIIFVLKIGGNGGNGVFCDYNQ